MYSINLGGLQADLKGGLEGAQPPARKKTGRSTVNRLQLAVNSNRVNRPVKAIGQSAALRAASILQVDILAKVR